MSIQKDFHTSTNAEHLQDLNARTSWGGFQEDLQKIFSQRRARDHARTPRGFHKTSSKIFSQGPVQDHTEVPGSISLGSVQDLLTRTCTRSCTARGFHHNLYKIFSQGTVKDLDQDLRAAEEDLTRSCYKNRATASQKSFHTSTSHTWHLQSLHARTS